jgi:Domain of unknown function (DUF4177)
MTRWEYQVLKFETAGLLGGIVDTDKVQQSLNALGREGWELVAADNTTMQQGATRDLLAILKREAPEDG